jgi:hypothetical protein
MILIRFLLIGLIAFLIARSFMGYSEEQKSAQRNSDPGHKDKSDNKRVSKKIGEFIDYEDVDKKN